MRISYWSSDVCSSDLLIGSLVVVLVAVRFAARSHGAGKGDATPGQLETPGANRHAGETSRDGLLGSAQTWLGRSRQRRDLTELDDRLPDDRSEERRVGKECVSRCRCRGGA